jgi:phosphopantothenoylcysteine decarboxylase/phosphopantothenate--cysteine ligase
MIHVQTAEEMYRAVMREAPSASVVIKAAAVCDWRPSASAAEKIKKEAGQVPSLELEPTIDILNEIGKNKLAGQIFVGFAAETENLEENARRKLAGKNLDMIVANDVTQPGAGFHTDTNAVKIITADDHVIAIPLMPKDRVADRVLDTVTRYRKRTSSKT